MKKIFLYGLISIFILVFYTVWINKKYNIYKAKSSSCEKNILCNPVYDLSVSGRPISKPLCKNLTSCMNQNVEYDDDDSDISLDFDDGDFRLPQIGCVTLSDATKLCCSGNLAICYSIQLLLVDYFNMYRGYSLAFTSTLCRALPSCFIENDSTPYLLFPISDFSIKVYDDDSDYLLNPDFEHDSLKKGISKLFGSLGAMPLSKSQACVYALTLPNKDTFSYFSLTPYFFQTGNPELVNNFPTDLPFASITDAFNYKNLENMDNPLVTKWLNGEIDKVTIFVIMTHNKNLAERIYNQILSDMQSVIKKYNIQVSDDESDNEVPPITCIPIPAGSTYGNSYNPFDQKMLADENNTDRGTKTNKHYKSETPLFDWKYDTLGLVGRIAPKNPDADNDDNDPYTIWKNNFQDQSNCFVLGLDEKSAENKDDYDYVPFQLNDQNGRFMINDNGQGYWVGACKIEEIKDNHTIDSYKKQNNYDSGDLIIKGENNNKYGSIDTRMEIITEQMKNIGYDVFTDIPMESDPSPFPYYNEYVNDIKGDIKKYMWSRSGIDLLQYNVSTYGDCRDTIYPTSHNFCLGKYDVAVIVSNNFCNNLKTPIGYNNLNVYDAQYQTSLASYRGDSVDDDCFSLAVSRSDLTCVLDFSKNTSSIIDNFQYINTGPHSSIYGTPTTSFFTQARVYYDKETGVSPNMSSNQSRYLVRVFKPCENKKPTPVICYNYETDECIQNESQSECSNDLTVKNKESNDDSEKISAGLCQFLRIDKTTNKTYATAYTFTFAGLFLVFTLIGIIYIFKNKKDFKYITTNYNYLLAPYLCIFIAVIISYQKINYITDQTAFDIKQTELQNNI